MTETQIQMVLMLPMMAVFTILGLCLLFLEKNWRAVYVISLIIAVATVAVCGFTGVNVGTNGIGGGCGEHREDVGPELDGGRKGGTPKGTFGPMVTQPVRAMLS